MRILVAGASGVLGQPTVRELRRAGHDVVGLVRSDAGATVVANLGATAASRVSVASPDSVLPPGRYSTRNLLRGSPGAALQVSRTGRIRGYVPLPGRLGPRQSLILDLR